MEEEGVAVTKVRRARKGKAVKAAEADGELLQRMVARTHE